VLLFLLHKGFTTGFLADFACNKIDFFFGAFFGSAVQFVAFEPNNPLIVFHQFLYQTNLLQSTFATAFFGAAFFGAAFLGAAFFGAAFFGAAFFGAAFFGAAFFGAAFFGAAFFGVAFGAVRQFVAFDPNHPFIVFHHLLYQVNFEQLTNFFDFVPFNSIKKSISDISDSNLFSIATFSQLCEFGKIILVYSFYFGNLATPLQNNILAMSGLVFFKAKNFFIIFFPFGRSTRLSDFIMTSSKSIWFFNSFLLLIPSLI